MTEQTALHQSLALDRDMMAARRTAAQVVNLLRDFIPEACIRDASDRVFEAACREGMEFTSKAQRKEYEALRAITLDVGLSPNLLR